MPSRTLVIGSYIPWLPYYSRCFAIIVCSYSRYRFFTRICTGILPPPPANQNVGYLIMIHHHPYCRKIIADVGVHNLCISQPSRFIFFVLSIIIPVPSDGMMVEDAVWMLLWGDHVPDDWDRDVLMVDIGWTTRSRCVQHATILALCRLEDRSVESVGRWEMTSWTSNTSWHRRFDNTQNESIYLHK